MEIADDPNNLRLDFRYTSFTSLSLLLQVSPGCVCVCEGWGSHSEFIFEIEHLESMIGRLFKFENVLIFDNFMVDISMNFL